MGLSKVGVQLIHTYISGADILCLGYPDIMAAPTYLDVEVSNRHERHGGGKVFDADSFFSKFKAKSVRYVDIAKFHGNEDVVDLNHPVDLGKYDLVIDPGTLEHCWNVAGAWENIFNAVRDGGNIYHNNPVTMVNHGFWNFSPTVYYDLYTQNGWGCQIIVEMDGNPYRVEKPNKRLDFGLESMAHVFATRHGQSPLKYPTQSKYL